MDVIAGALAQPRAIALAAIPGRQLIARFAACSVLPCARRSSPLVAASGMAAAAWAAWREVEA